jgi:RimJ/RimL family protein N-acetyltransferase
MDANNIVFLQDRELVLRPIHVDDVPFLTRIANDPEVTQYINLYLPVTEISERDWVERLRKPSTTDLVLLITLQDGVRETQLGTVSLGHIDPRDRTAMFGISIGEKKCWNKGYGTRTLQLILGYAFNTLNLRKVCLTVLDMNQRGIRCYEKCGFKQEGRFKLQRFRNGAYVDEIRMAVFANEWRVTHAE